MLQRVLSNILIHFLLTRSQTQASFKCRDLNQGNRQPLGHHGPARRALRFLGCELHPERGSAPHEARPQPRAGPRVQPASSPPARPLKDRRPRRRTDQRPAPRMSTPDASAHKKRLLVHPAAPPTAPPGPAPRAAQRPARPARRRGNKGGRPPARHRCSPGQRAQHGRAPAAPLAVAGRARPAGASGRVLPASRSSALASGRASTSGLPAPPGPQPLRPPPQPSGLDRPASLPRPAVSSRGGWPAAPVTCTASHPPAAVRQ